MIDRVPCTNPIEIQRYTPSSTRHSRAYCPTCRWAHTLDKPRPLVRYSSDTGVSTIPSKGDPYSRDELQAMHDAAAHTIWRRFQQRKIDDTPRLPKHLMPDE